MTARILAAASPGEVRVAVVRDGMLLDYAIWRPGAPDGVGDIHRGRVIARVPAMAGAFVALDGAEGFLPDSDGGAALTEGDFVPVQVTRAAQGGKGPRLTARFASDAVLLGDGPAALIAPGPGALLELAALMSALTSIVRSLVLVTCSTFTLLSHRGLLSNKRPSSSRSGSNGIV